MAAAFTIPRFLLPQSGLIWRRANLGNRLLAPEVLIVRYASSSSAPAKGKPIVLEKPERFNPPSHGARLPRKNRPQQQHYGGALSGEDVAAQRKKDYPGLPPPPDTWAHWFWSSRAVHMCITMGTLASLALYTATENFKANSPFADMLPTNYDYWQHPIVSLRTFHEVWKLTMLHESAVTAEKRKKKVDDVVKRSEYRKAHGLEQQGGLGNWTAREERTEPVAEASQPEPGQKREKFLGIF
ncbi:unnamed protein product [Discula destructiva]